MSTLQDLLNFLGEVEISLWLCGPDGYYSRHKDVVKYTRAIAKAIKKERHFKSYHVVAKCDPDIRFGEESERCLADFKAWWEANQPSWDLLDSDGPIHDQYLFGKVQEEGWSLPYASYAEFKSAVESVTHGLTEEQQQHFRNIIGVTFALGRSCAP